MMVATPSPHRRFAIGLALLLSVSGLTVNTTPAMAAPADGTALATPVAVHVAEAAQRFGIPEGWIWSVMRIESGGQPRALSPKGAMGLMQIMPATWNTLTTRYGLGGDPFDIRANIHAGAAYLRQMWDRYGNVTAMLAAYNAGPARADAYVSGRGSLPAETRGYVARIAPAIDGVAAPASIASPSVRPTSWRQSMLFTQSPIQQSDQANAATGDGAPSQSNTRFEVPRTPVSAALNALFVPITGRQRP